jgi:hypothetical protein
MQTRLQVGSQVSVTPQEQGCTAASAGFMRTGVKGTQEPRWEQDPEVKD